MHEATPRGPWVEPTFARRYEETFARTVAPLVGEALLRLARPQAGETVLECACGTGAFTILLAHALHPSGTLVCTDRAKAMIDVAAAKQLPPGSAQPAFVTLDMLAVALSDAQFDLVTCNLGMQIVPNRQQALHQLRNVLRAGGRLAFAVPGEWSLEPFWTFFWQRASRPDALQALRSAPAPWTPADIAASLDQDRRAWRQQVEGAGFQAVDLTVDGGTAWFPSADAFLATGAFGHIDRAKALFTDEEVAEQVLRDVGLRLRETASSHGIPIDITVLCVVGYRS